MNTTLRDNFLEDMKKFAHESEAVEVCGLILYEDDKFVLKKCRNFSDMPDVYFEIHPADFLTAKLSKKLVAIFHSHTHGPTMFSEYDMSVSRECLYPYIMYSCETKEFKLFYEDNYEPEMSVIKLLEDTING